MTYRERREARAERLRTWADKREDRGAAERARAQELTDAIPFGQPILVGHHSEKADRRRRDRAWDGLGRGIELERSAEGMRSRADEIERQADRAIYRDDADALERLRERIAELEAEREQMKARNAAYRKAHAAELRELTPYGRNQAVPHPSYELQNLGGNIGRLRKRLELVPVQQANAARDRVLVARYAGTCADCGAPLVKGQTIRYSKSAGARCAESCAAVAAELERVDGAA